MRTTQMTTLVLAGLVTAVSACGSDPDRDLTGEWTGKCTTTQVENGNQTTTDVAAILEFGPDGEYFQKTAGPEGGEVEGTYTVTEDTITLVGADGRTVNADYTLKDGTLTLTTPDPTATPGITSTCTLTQN